MTYTTVTDGVDYPQATHINQFATGLDNLETGWTTGVGTWTYASATSITIPSGGTSIYAVGDKIKLTQTTVKYFYVVGVASTTLTITGGTDYTLTNAAITSPYYSHMGAPVGFPGYFNFTVTPTFTAGAAPTTEATSVCIFSIQGRMCTVSIYKSYTNAGTTVTLATMALPVAQVGAAHAAYGFLGVGATPSNIYADVQTTIRIAATSSSANRLIAGATYPI